ncbi:MULTISPECIES: glycogen debranching protein GlgX [Phyllobacteriaceae]|uniref:Glycogen debranching enzyme GlgX n=1 Tax=Mesorhizobium hungaricum TaxID=1566387 RepID=A0A1C2DJ45_9HYPH|nr:MULTISPECIES: glycogen debranching protein GlgX [Mesorhizobium]MBN9233185.1 glycogen debranching protein GlgX [Mesorhizobium sp.]OCX14794.1 glycogen debranching enzyme GlgX [Mesorhizobium hungaricum]
MAILGARPDKSGTEFTVWSSQAGKIELCLFDADDRETQRLPMARGADDIFRLRVGGIGEGARYGLRADGDYAPERGLWFDPEKLLVDPYAVEIDRPYVYDARLAARRGEGGDTAPLMPKAVVRALSDPVSARAPLFEPGGLIYELSVRSFSMRHPQVPDEDRGTLRALAHPAIVDHLKKIGVSAVELMPVTAKIDERHLPPLGLTNGWGYNPVTFMALDPRLAPRGIADLRSTTKALHGAGIGVILDLVFNHTGESDERGPTLSLRGLDSRAYYRHAPDGRLVNDTGTGNTLACDHPAARDLVLASLRHFVRNAGVDGFRFDLAPVLGRNDQGFNANAPLLAAMRTDPLLSDRILIAEPWDIGPGGYQLGRFGQPFLEWNDKYRDDVRRFWRGDAGMVGRLATGLAGSSDVFPGTASRTVNFIAAHDGMTLADLVSYEKKHNEANGEANRDGHDENLSWNHGVEGESDDAGVALHRAGDQRALLATLFASRGAIMLTAGDEFGRSQRGNNNAYAQDNAITWLDWAGRDRALEDHVAALAALRGAVPVLRDPTLLTGQPQKGDACADVEWLTETGQPMDDSAWNDPRRRRLAMVLGVAGVDGGRLAVLVNGDRRASSFVLPVRDGYNWVDALDPAADAEAWRRVEGRAVVFMSERKR